MDVKDLIPFVKQAMNSANPQVQQLATQLNNQLNNFGDPDGETAGEDIVDIENVKQEDGGENLEGQLMEPAFKELEVEEMQDNMEEQHGGNNGPGISSFIGKQANYWDLLKSRYGNNRR